MQTWPPLHQKRVAVSGVIVVLLAIGLVIGVGIGFVAAPSFEPKSTQTITSTYTQTKVVPKNSTITGTASTLSSGDQAEEITFTSINNGTSYHVDLTAGHYTILLPNQDTYTVKVTYNIIGSIAFGSCVAGNFPLYLQSQVTVTVNWSC